MTQKAWLTAIWLGAFVACLVLVEAYVWRRDVNGVPLLLPRDRWSLVKPIAGLYSAYLAGVIGAWFLKPWKALPFDQAERPRFVIALVCTLLWNGVVIYLVAQKHLSGGEGGLVADDVTLATQIGASLAILVWPVNVYYFGAKSPAASV